MPDRSHRSAQPRPGPRRHLRSLFVSDLHLGARGSKAGAFLTFLQGVEADAIFLVGDILDIWHCGKVHWGETHDAILQELRDRQAAGTRVVYLPGNHDVALKAQYGSDFDGFELCESLTHEAADGTRYLVLHGDQCDARIFRWHLMTRIGSRVDGWLRALDAWLRRQLNSTAERGVIELALSGVNSLMLAGNRFEERLADMARAGGHDGVICGHFHKAALHLRDGITYANCGDWIDSLTALAETADGALQLMQWDGLAYAAPQDAAQAIGVSS